MRMRAGALRPSRREAVTRPVSLVHTSCIPSTRRCSQGGVLPRTADRLIAEAQEMMRLLDEPGPYVFVGHSVGGQLVQSLAHELPDETVAVVALDSVPILHWCVVCCSLAAHAAAILTTCAPAYVASYSHADDVLAGICGDHVHSSPGVCTHACRNRVNSGFCSLPTLLLCHLIPPLSGTQLRCNVQVGHQQLWRGSYQRSQAPSALRQQDHLAPA